MAPVAAVGQEAPAMIDIPVNIGQSVKEIRVPHHNAQGKLSLRLNAASAERSSNTEFTFGDLRIEIFDNEAEQAALEVLLPEAVFDQNTRRLVSDRHSIIKGENIEITGREMEFNVDSRTSRLLGPVTMIISNTDKLQP
jgi:lipopolysaccharide export system protein LptC